MYSWTVLKDSEEYCWKEDFIEIEDERGILHQTFHIGLAELLILKLQKLLGFLKDEPLCGAEIVNVVCSSITCSVNVNCCGRAEIVC